jgi:RNA polymerase sigma factor (sigma-70 family)
MNLGEKINTAELSEAWRGFCRWQRKKGFSQHFIWSDGVDMFAQAQLELSGSLAKGIEIHNPPGWLINCALQRTKNLLDKRMRAPSTISEDQIEPLRSMDPTPEETLLEDERRYYLRDAISSLLPPERKVIELIYFQEMSCRAAADTLGWANSKADRNHHRALRRLRPLLGRIESERALLGRLGSEGEGSP